MKTYCIYSIGFDGEKILRWIQAEDYYKAKAKFYFLYPDQSIVSMWLKVEE